jgi:release factor glutamine methyltransferase
MTIQQVYHFLQQQLSTIYDTDEAANIADLVIEHITGYKKLGRITHKDLLMNKKQIEQLQTLTIDLLEHKPVHYVLGEAWFYEMKFYVNEHVLIPRPETEELVELVTSYKLPVTSILDIGTGSGCIPITLKKKLPKAHVTSIDISANALAVAQQNAANLNTEISFKELDFLNETNWADLDCYDIIVSNPPYIKQSESANMHVNVLLFEPHIALFVEDEDALLFYRKIADFGKTHLNALGKIFVEINEVLGAETVTLFESYGYEAILKKDMQGKDRMIIATIL